MMTLAAAVLGAIVALELLALVGRRSWSHWKHGTRDRLVDEAVTALADSVVGGAPVEPPRGRVRRRAYRLAALELFAVLAGESRARLTRLVEETDLVEDASRTLRRSLRAYARRTAADELAEIRSPRAAEVLAARLGDRDPIVRVACVRGLASLPELGEIERMLMVLDRDATEAPSGAGSAMLALAATAPDELARLQVEGASPFARRLAALALAAGSDERAVPWLLGELATENAVLSFVAVRAIERIGGGESIAALERVVADTARDPGLRDEAKQALTRVVG